MGESGLKDSVLAYWDKASCGTEFSDKEKHSREYYDELEQHRYHVEPEVFSFAQFARHHGQKLLEVGVGAGHDFTQWVRAGTEAHGIDLTEEGVEHVRKRLAVYGLEAKDIRKADCEALPYSDDTFDLVYSWGVIHHTPDTHQAFREIVRVCRPGGTCKIMVYHRYSLVALHLWLRYALFKGKPWRSLAWCVANYMESPDTKSYRGREIWKMACRASGRECQDLHCFDELRRPSLFRHSR